MAEKQVTIGDKSYRLKTPFVVMATQNPIEQEGTYNLPEAQLDRFMMKVHVDYPDFDAEASILDLKMASLESLSPQLNSAKLGAMKEAVDTVFVDEKIKKLIVKIVHATRPGNDNFMRKYDGAILAGASPRASIWLYKLSKFKAFLAGSDHVAPEHILAITRSVLVHRVLLTYEAAIDKINVRDVVQDIANECI